MCYVESAGPRTIRSEQGLDGVLGRSDIVLVFFCNLPRLEIDTRSPGGGVADLRTPLAMYVSKAEKGTKTEYLFHLCY